VHCQATHDRLVRLEASLQLRLYELPEQHAACTVVQ
jgi:hypothetical protein